MMTLKITDSYSIKDLTNKYRNGYLTPLDYIKNELKKISFIMNTTINAIVEVMPQDIILNQAIESTKRYQNKCELGPFDGVPITVKDSILCEIKGRKMEMGSMINNLDQYGGVFGYAEETSPQIQMLTKQGAIILAITTCPEIGHKGTTTSYLRGITRSPHDKTLSTGGSSGGSAALIALKVGNISIGTDGAGSIRIPSAWCGVFGFKPSYNIGCCNHPMWPYIGVAGPMSLYIDDIRLYMKELCLQKNDYASTSGCMNWSESYMKLGLKNVNIAVSRNYDGVVDYVDDKIWNQITRVTNYLQKLGANVTFIEPPLSEIKQLFDSDYMRCLLDLWYSFMGPLYGDYIEQYNYGYNKYMVDPGIIEIYERSKRMSMRQLNMASSIRDKIIEIMTKFHQTYDLLITATTATLPLNALSYDKDMFMMNRNTNQIVKWFDCYHSYIMFTCLCNLTYQPAISLNVGFERTLNGKAPIGMQIIGRNNEDNMVLRAAYVVQQQFKPLIAKL
eukprot:180145_1